MGKKIVVFGACLVLMSAAVAGYLWHTRYRLPEAVRLESQLSRTPFVLQQGNPWCEVAMSVHQDDYVRPVFKLISTGETLPPTIRLRDFDIPGQDLPKNLEGMFKLRAERTVFLLTAPGIAPRYVNDLLRTLRNSPFVNNVCVIDSQALSEWFPKTPEPRG